ncbi:TonB-dependent receptor [Pelomonas saccharophila]|uniref:TonB-dependent receptor n=1 Tax=Roseateles saccharophilus TaxID=304 RepID=A0ABU1YUD8_ROSSA|nr:TonB-dependent receptor [Roseateles saccharophilus]MDR7272460.1 TonB-dependent receptor [Roseateles saccharophilus]
MRQPRPALRLTTLATASGLLFASAAAWAQGGPGQGPANPNAGPTPSSSVPQALASTTQLETVIVTGIRKSLETSVNLKRSSSGLVDGIVAEDIGKFPDTNLAESLSRISGVSIDRSNGEGTRITVRGMGPDFNLVLLNGRQMPGASVDGSAPSSRSFDFSNLASDGVAALEVYKTSRASSPTGGMGATINIRTPRPFDTKETIAQVGVKLVSDQSARRLPGEEQGKNATPELSGIYSTQTNDGTFGIALMGTYQVRDSGYSQANVSSGWKTFDGIVDNDWGGSHAAWGGLPPASQATEIKNRPAIGSIYSVPQNLNYSFTGVHRERLNGQLVMQFKPTKDLVGTLDFVMSEQKFRQRRNDISAWFNYGGQFGEFQTGSPSSPIIYGEHMANSDLAMGASRIQTKNKNQQIGLNLKWKATDALSFDIDAHHSTATSGANDPLGTSVTLATASLNRGDTFVDFSNKFPVLNIKGATLDPTKQELQGSVFGNSYQKNQVDQLQTKGNWKLNEDSSLDFGLTLTNVKNRSAFANVQRDTWGANAAGGPAAMPDDIWRADSISKYFSRIPGSNDPRLFNQFFYFNFEDLRGAAIKALGSDALLKASFDWQDDYRTTEKSQAVFGQYNLNWEWGVPMEAAIGARYERTKVHSPSVEKIPVSVAWVADNEIPISFNGTRSASRDGKYGYFLPSIDLAADVTSDTKLRVSYGQTIGRPGWNAIQGGQRLDPLARVDGGSASVGNPDLKPLHSSNFDFSAEHYYAKSSYIAASYFRKSLKDYNEAIISNVNLFGLHTPVGNAMYNQAMTAGGCGANSGCIRQYIFTNFPNAPGVAPGNGPGLGTITAQPNDPLLMFKLGSYINNQRTSKLNGIELNAQHIFGNSGFGVSANFTKVRSNLSYDNNKAGAQTDVLVGLGDSGNLVGFFENETFTTRLAYNWRGKFLAANFGGTDGAQPLYVEPYGQLDLSVGYNFNSHLRFQLEAINLTDEYTRTHLRNENQVGAVTQLGRRVMIGARYKF